MIHIILDVKILNKLMFNLLTKLYVYVIAFMTIKPL